MTAQNSPLRGLWAGSLGHVPLSGESPNQRGFASLFLSLLLFLSVIALLALAVQALRRSHTVAVNIYVIITYCLLWRPHHRIFSFYFKRRPQTLICTICFPSLPTSGTGDWFTGRDVRPPVGDSQGFASEDTWMEWRQCGTVPKAAGKQCDSESITYLLECQAAHV